MRESLPEPVRFGLKRLVNRSHLAAFARMIDKTLAHMIDETLRGHRNSFRFRTLKMLEVRVNRAHLSGSPICMRAPLLHAPSNLRDFVRDLFTICRFAAFIETRDLRPVRSIRP